MNNFYTEEEKGVESKKIFLDSTMCERSRVVEQILINSSEYLLIKKISC